MPNIKAGLQEKWEQMILINSKDEYSKATVNAAIDVMDGLDAGEDCKKAHDRMYGHGLTGFMAGCVANMIWNYSPRGEEFKVFWNKDWGGDGTESGTVNPAIMTVGSPDA